MEVEIRDLTVEDLPRMYESISGLIKITLNQLEENLIKRISCKEITIVALVDGRFAGILCATINHKLTGGNVAFLEDLYVMSEFRKQGVGVLLGKYIIKRIWDVGCTKALSYTGVDNIPANKVNRQNGGVVQENDLCWKFIKQGVI